MHGDQVEAGALGDEADYPWPPDGDYNGIFYVRSWVPLHFFGSGEEVAKWQGVFFCGL